QGSHVFVDAAAAEGAIGRHDVALGVEPLLETFARGQDEAAGPFVARGPPAKVTMKSSKALQQDVSGGQIRDHKVGIDVQALLQGLGSDEDEGAGRTLGSHKTAYLLIHKGSI